VLCVGTMLVVREMCRQGGNVRERMETVRLMTTGWDLHEDQAAMGNWRNTGESVEYGRVTVGRTAPELDVSQGSGYLVVWSSLGYYGVCTV
jgi:hypothetical protein